MFGLAIEAGAQGPGTEAGHRAAQAGRGRPRASTSSTTPELNETVIRGLGELHLRVMLERMKERYGVEVKIAAAAHRLPRDHQRARPRATTGTRSRPAAPASSARCSCGSSRCRAAPASSSSTRSRAAPFPASTCRRSRKACARCLHGGAIAGYQLQDVRVIVYDGKYHPVDSKEVAFVAAGKKAFLDAIGKARPQMLEPIVDLDGHRAGTAHGRHHRRAGGQARAHQRHRFAARRRDRDQGAGAAVGTDRLRGRTQRR